MDDAGYYPSPWPAEDGGPRRLQVPRSDGGLGIRPGERLQAVVRAIRGGTMTVLGAPGELFLLTHSMLRSNLGLPTTSRVERLDPDTLRTVRRSPRLPGGPMWPGGMAVHANGSLYVVYGRWAHRLDRDCRPTGSLELPASRPYNSFVVLDDGMIVTKNLSQREPSLLTVIDPETMRPACGHVTCPEATVARLSAAGDVVYVVGVRSIFRYRWDRDRARLEFDDDWRFDYVGASRQSWGWDVVIDGHDAWFMDNGHHRYVVSMIGAGVAPTPNRLVRVSLSDAGDHSTVEVCGSPGGSITNPPFVDPVRGIVLGYDSANRHLRAWRRDDRPEGLSPLWEKPEFGHASHVLAWPATGEIAVNDYRRRGEEVVVLDLETGHERGRIRIGGLAQGVVFPGAGFGRDFYWTTFLRLARIFPA